MEISLWNIQDWLANRGFKTSARISDREAAISGIRLCLSGGQAQMGLVGGRADFFYDTQGTYIKAGNSDIEVKNVHGYPDFPAAVFNAAQECFEFYNHWEKKLADCCLTADPFQEMLDASAAVFPYPLAICNMNAKALAVSKWHGPEPVYFRYLKDYGMMPLTRAREMAGREDASEVFRAREAQVVYENNSEIHGAAHLHGNFWLGNSLVGFVMAFNPGNGFRRGDIWIMNVLRTWIEKYVAQRSDLQFSDSMLSDYLTFMLAKKGSYDTEDFAETLNNMGWRIGDEYLALRIEQRSLRQATPFLRRTGERLQSRFREFCVFVQDGGLTALFNQSKTKDPQGVLAAFFDFIKEDNLIIGVSFPFRNLMDFPAGFKQAGFALDSLRNPPGKKGMTEIADFSDMAVEEIGRIARANEDLIHMIHPDVMRLRRYDQQNGGAYAQNLYQYIFCGCNLTDAAKMAGVHRNTMIYRIEKINSLLSLDLNNPQSRLLLFISCALLGLPLEN